MYGITIEYRKSSEFFYSLIFIFMHLFIFLLEENQIAEGMV